MFDEKMDEKTIVTQTIQCESDLKKACSAIQCPILFFTNWFKHQRFLIMFRVTATGETTITKNRKNPK